MIDRPMHRGLLKGARPIEHPMISQHHDRHVFRHTSLDQYSQAWRLWIAQSQLNHITGLDDFAYADFAQGTTQAFDQFALRHGHQRVIAWFKGDFAYHRCVGKKLRHRELDHWAELSPDHALIMSLPFSALGTMHTDFQQIMDRCNELHIPVCLDLAYWGISKQIHLALDHWPCVQEITCSLSKPFHTLERHRVGIRFSRLYLDDGISMLNEVGMQNPWSMSLAMHFMQEFSCDWNWQQHQDHYVDLCAQLQLNTTDTIIFGISHDPSYQDFNRGIPMTHRVCLSSLLKDIIHENKQP